MRLVLRDGKLRERFANTRVKTSPSVLVNDVHSALNPTRVAGVIYLETADEIAEAIQLASQQSLPIAISGSRHAMGGQQFVSDGLLLDLRQLKRVIYFDRENGHLRVEAGIQWPELIAYYLEVQGEDPHPWGIAQKQTGADTFTLGGSLSANVHGRGLSLRPFIQDIEAFTLVDSVGKKLKCSRAENAELFALVIGGYGLFGVVTDVTLRLVRRQKLERVVEIADAANLDEKFRQRIDDGFLYGDFQFSIDEASSGFLREGVFSCYRPTERPVPDKAPRELEEKSWLQLLLLAYTNRAAAYEKYAEYYLSTNGQVYWSDTHQLSPYLPDYAGRIQQLSGAAAGSSLMITELYVPRADLDNFLRDAAQDLRQRGVIVIYGTVRLIEKDTESFLAWAKDSYACIIFNLLVEHSEAGRKKTAAAFRSLINLAAELGGSYYLTYHRHASRAQFAQCYPQFGEFLAKKDKFDPCELFQSDWYRHHRGLWEE